MELTNTVPMLAGPEGARDKRVPNYRSIQNRLESMTEISCLSLGGKAKVKFTWKSESKVRTGTPCNDWYLRHSIVAED